MAGIIADVSAFLSFHNFCQNTQFEVGLWLYAILHWKRHIILSLVMKARQFLFVLLT